MNPETREALYAAFDLDSEEEYKRGRACLLEDYFLGASVEQLTWDDFTELEDTTRLYDSLTVRFVLPRWLELLTDDEAPFWPIGEDGLQYKLSDKKWLQWPAPQVEAIRRVFEEWRETKMRQGRILQFVEFIGQIETDVSRYLDPWVRARPIEVAQWLWDTQWTRPSALRAWVVSPRVEQKLEETFFRNPDGEHAPLLSNAIQLVRSLRALES